MATQTPQTPTEEEMNKFKEIFRESIFIFKCEKEICRQKPECKSIRWEWLELSENLFAVFNKEVYLTGVEVVYNKETGEGELLYKAPMGGHLTAKSIRELIDKIISMRYEYLNSMIYSLYEDATWSWHLDLIDDQEIMITLETLSNVIYTKKYDLDDILSRLKRLHELYRWKSKLACD